MCRLAAGDGTLGSALSPLEARRVLRPGAVLHFVEHGLAPDDAVLRSQRRGNVLSRRLAGCVLVPQPAGFCSEGNAAA